MYNHISIHAPRGGSDAEVTVFGYAGRISIHAPRGGSDLRRPAGWTVGRISIHAPRGGSDKRKDPLSPLFMISIHAPRGGSDHDRGDQCGYCGNFNPRSPWGERRPFRSDHRPFRDFNPRSPWGERLSRYSIYFTSHQFQSTLPVGGATLRPSRPGRGMPALPRWYSSTSHCPDTPSSPE